MGSWLLTQSWEWFAELPKAGHIGRVHRIIALAMVQMAIFLRSCLKLGYSEACTIHLGRIISAYKLFFGFLFILLVFGL